jgi:hypothetical protein
MSWPEAFVLVGFFVAGAFIVWCVMKMNAKDAEERTKIMTEALKQPGATWRVNMRDPE